MNQVHTPDGSPCGLLNHLAKDAVVVAFPVTKRMPATPSGRIVAAAYKSETDSSISDGAWNAERVNSRPHLQQLLASLGMVPAGVSMGDGQLSLDKAYSPILLDGVVLGGIPVDYLPNLVAQLRLLKSLCNASAANREYLAMGTAFRGKKWCLDPTIELASILPAQYGGGAYPGLYLFTQPGRMIRPVHQILSERTEWIGPMEQVYMEIACLKEDIREDTTHIEQHPAAMLSHIASLTPFSDCNQVHLWPK